MEMTGNTVEKNGTGNETNIHHESDWYTFMLSHMCTARGDYITRMVIFAIFVLFGVLGNISLLIVILKDKHLRNSPNILICNLAVADLMYIVVMGPVRIEHEIHPCWFLGSLACALKNYVPVVCQCVCVYSLVALSRERYSAIVSGIQAHVSNQLKMTICWALTAWLFGILFAAPIFSEQFSYISIGVLCMSVKHGSTTAKIYETCRMFILYIIPLIIISVHYIIMAKALIRSTKTFKESSSQFIKQVNARKRLAYLSIILSIFFGLFWLPSYVYTLLYHFTSPDDFKGDFLAKFRYFHYYMSLANSSLNPWLVFVLSSTHRKRLRNCFTCSKVAQAMSSFRSSTQGTAMYQHPHNTVTTSLSLRDNKNPEN